MSFNIIDLVKDQISDQVMGQMGGLLGDESSKAEAGISNAIPAMLSGFTNSGGTASGADALFKAVNDQDDGLLDNLGSMLGSNNSSSMIDKGSSVLGSLFGSSGLGSLAGVVSGLSGLSKGNTGSLMGMLAPVIFSVLKRKVLGGGMNAGGLMDMLKGQSSNINAAMPVGLSDQLNSSGFLSSITNVGGAAVDGVRDAAGGVRDAAGNVVGGVTDAAGNVVSGVSDAAGNVASGVAGAAGSAVDGVSNVAGSAASSVRGGAGAVGNAASDAAAGGSSMFKKLIPVLALALLGFLGWKMFGGSAKDAADSAADAASSAASTATDAASSATDAVTSTASGAVDAVKDAAGFDLDASTKGLNDMFGSAKDSLGGITDLDSAKAAVPGLTELGGKFTSLTDSVPEGASGALAPVIKTGLGILEPLLEKVRAIPGVGALIDPILTPMLEKMQQMAG